MTTEAEEVRRGAEAAKEKERQRRVDFEYALANARRLAACWNACIDEDVEYLEGVVAMNSTLRKEMNKALAQKERYQEELCAMERERDLLRGFVERLQALAQSSVDIAKTYTADQRR